MDALAESVGLSMAIGALPTSLDRVVRAYGVLADQGMLRHLVWYAGQPTTRANPTLTYSAAFTGPGEVPSGLDIGLILDSLSRRRARQLPAQVTTGHDQGQVTLGIRCLSHARVVIRASPASSE